MYQTENNAGKGDNAEYDIFYFPTLFSKAFFIKSEGFKQAILSRNSGIDSLSFLIVRPEGDD